jgi:hypothetical protein
MEISRATYVRAAAEFPIKKAPMLLGARRTVDGAIIIHHGRR